VADGAQLRSHQRQFHTRVWQMHACMHAILGVLKQSSYLQMAMGPLPGQRKPAAVLLLHCSSASASCNVVTCVTLQPENMGQAIPQLEPRYHGTVSYYLWYLLFVLCRSALQAMHALPFPPIAARQPTVPAAPAATTRPSTLHCASHNVPKTTSVSLIVHSRPSTLGVTC
jgi:hypothetical protein